MSIVMVNDDDNLVDQMGGGWSTTTSLMWSHQEYREMVPMSFKYALGLICDELDREKIDLTLVSLIQKPRNFHPPPPILHSPFLIPETVPPSSSPRKRK